MNRLVRRLAKALKRLLPQWLFDVIDPLGHGVEAWVAAAVNGFPGLRMRVIGITGTNGKTSTAILVAQVFRAAGYRVGLSTTALYWVGERQYANDRNTTVTNPWDLQRLLSQMRKAGLQIVVLEVTSHALAQNRVAGVHFEAVALTNITQDHLDYHRTMERYIAAKERLFKKPGLKVSVLNFDDAVYARYARHSAESHMSYSLEAPATLRASNIIVNSTGTTFDLEYNGHSEPVVLQLPGRFNVENSLAAAGLALGCGLNVEQVVSGLATLPAVPGRMETIEAGQNFAVIVDYAHTPDALENLYSTLRGLTQKRLIVILGAAGDRDRGKRPIMGKLAAELCDYVILTDEEAYSEDPQSIIDQIEPGVVAGGGVKDASYEVILDRREAISKAFAMARPGDTVALTGMGHQQYRVATSGKMNWDEREIARDLLGERR
jgi:UDP-N-acetylmuramoyl-L-alanyl-D-glutamate--2,6-diaminopimelate ligase